MIFLIKFFEFVSWSVSLCFFGVILFICMVFDVIKNKWVEVEFFWKRKLFFLNEILWLKFIKNCCSLFEKEFVVMFIMLLFFN